MKMQNCRNICLLKKKNQFPQFYKYSGKSEKEQISWVWPKKEDWYFYSTHGYKIANAARYG